MACALVGSLMTSVEQRFSSSPRRLAVCLATRVSPTGSGRNRRVPAMSAALRFHWFRQAAALSACRWLALGIRRWQSSRLVTATEASGWRSGRAFDARCSSHRWTLALICARVSSCNSIKRSISSSSRSD